MTLELIKYNSIIYNIMKSAVLIQSSKGMKKGLHYWDKPVPASIKGISKITFFLKVILVYFFSIFF
jgi:hypothetical protein